jgi:hypothetical protein
MAFFLFIMEGEDISAGLSRQSAVSWQLFAPCPLYLLVDHFVIS